MVCTLNVCGGFQCIYLGVFNGLFLSDADLGAEELFCTDGENNARNFETMQWCLELVYETKVLTFHCLGLCSIRRVGSLNPWTSCVAILLELLDQRIGPHLHVPTV